MSGTCGDRAGNVSSPLAFKLAYDATGPRVLGMRASRSPDHRGWYDHPVRLRFRARDALSGGARCASLTYRGPEGPNATAQATCVDRAGNAAVRSFTLRYDATPPALRFKVSPGDRMGILRWKSEAGVRRFAVTRWIAHRPWTRRTIYRGRGNAFVDTRLSNRRRYRYAVVASDPAGNRTRRSGAVRPGRRLLVPRATRVRRPPLLRWTPVHGARFYNVQLFRGRTRVLSAWPRGARYRLPAAWEYDGRARRLEPGSYRWYAWPAGGRRSAPRYGRRVGQSRFVVLPPAVTQ